jgi:hypothetical protein
VKFKAKAAKRPVMIAAASLLAANVGLSMATGHQSGSATAAVGPLVIAAFSLVAARPLAWLLGRKIPLLWLAYKSVEGLARKVLTAPTFQVEAGAWLAIGWLGILCANAWTAVGRRPTPWLAPWSVVTDPGTAYATGGGVLGAVLLLGTVVTVAIVLSKKARNRPGKDDVHALDLERLLAPTWRDTVHLRVKPGSDAEVLRPYLCDALVKRPRLGGLWTTWPVVPLHLVKASAGLGVFAVPGKGKFVSTVCNTALRPGGARTQFDDGFGLGFVGPQVFVSNTAEIAGTIRWRVQVARAALRLGAGGVEPTHEEIRELVTIFDPTGACHSHPDLEPYRKGWSPLDGVSDWTSAKKLAEGLLATELTSTTTNAEHFAKAAVRILTAFLLAAVRGGHPLSQVCSWSDAIQQADSKVPGLIARLLTGVNADPQDAQAHEQFLGTCQRLDDSKGEGSAVFGTIEKCLAPFTTPAVSSSTDPRFNLAMIDGTVATTTPYATTYVVMPTDSLDLASTRPVFIAFMEELIATGVKEAIRHNPMHPGLAVPLLITLDELENTHVMPKLGANLATFRKYNMRVQWVTETYDGLTSGFSENDTKKIVANSGAILTYAGGVADDHTKTIVEAIGARTVTRVSRSTRSGEDGASESASKEQVQPVDMARLLSEMHADKMVVQLTGSNRGIATGRKQLRPFLGRQHRAAASEDEIDFGWYVNEVMHARLEDGTAAGVAAQNRPSDRRWVRPAQRLYRSLAARTRRPWAVPTEE